MNKLKAKHCKLYVKQGDNLLFECDASKFFANVEVEPVVVRTRDVPWVLPYNRFYIWGLANTYYSEQECIEAFKRFKAACEVNAKRAVEEYRRKVKRCKTTECM